MSAVRFRPWPPDPPRNPAQSGVFCFPAPRGCAGHRRPARFVVPRQRSMVRSASLRALAFAPAWIGEQAPGIRRTRLRPTTRPAGIHSRISRLRSDLYHPTAQPTGPVKGCFIGAHCCVAPTGGTRTQAVLGQPQSPLRSAGKKALDRTLTAPGRFVYSGSARDPGIGGWLGDTGLTAQRTASTQGVYDQSREHIPPIIKWGKNR